MSKKYKALCKAALKISAEHVGDNWDAAIVLELEEIKNKRIQSLVDAYIHKITNEVEK